MNNKANKEFKEIDFSAYSHLPRIVGRDFSIVDEAKSDGFAYDVFTCLVYIGVATTREQRWAIVEALRDDPRPIKLTISAELIERGLFPTDRRPFWMPEDIGPKEWESSRRAYEERRNAR